MDKNTPAAEQAAIEQHGHELEPITATDLAQRQQAHTPLIGGQQLIDAGINVFALHLLMESVGKLKLPPGQEVGNLAFQFKHRGEHAEIILTFHRLTDEASTEETDEPSTG